MGCLHSVRSLYVTPDLQIFVCNPRPPNVLHLLCIWVKCVGVWGKITPMKWSVSIKLYPMSKGRMLLSKILPQTSKKFTQIYLPYLWHYATLASSGCFEFSAKWRHTRGYRVLELGLLKTWFPAWPNWQIVNIPPPPQNLKIEYFQHKSGHVAAETHLLYLPILL